MRLIGSTPRRVVVMLAVLSHGVSLSADFLSLSILCLFVGVGGIVSALSFVVISYIVPDSD